jgi:hypothetical protein
MEVGAMTGEVIVRTATAGHTLTKTGQETFHISCLLHIHSTTHGNHDQERLSLSLKDDPR